MARERERTFFSLSLRAAGYIYILRALHAGVVAARVFEWTAADARGMDFVGGFFQRRVSESSRVYVGLSESSSLRGRERRAARGVVELAGVGNAGER